MHKWENPLNFIETAEPVDFSYEISRWLAACKSTLLLVDSAQGVEEQIATVSYVYVENVFEIIPAINQIDLPHTNLDRVRKEIENIIEIVISDPFIVSVKNRIWIYDLFETIVKRALHLKGIQFKPRSKNYIFRNLKQFESDFFSASDKLSIDNVGKDPSNVNK